jgi:RNA polymerase sigma-54 factor
MQSGFELILEQKQGLVLTPELIQAIRILQYNAQELEIFIEEQVLANPVLETEQTEPDAETEASETADRELQAPEDVREIGGEQRREDFDWLEYLQQKDYDDVSYGHDFAVRDAERSAFSPEPRAAQGTQGAPDSQDVTLSEHLMFQLQFAKLSPEVTQIARYIIESLDGSGYLTQTKNEITEQLNARPKAVEKALAAIRSLDPVGVGAVDLADCLIMQLRDRGHDRPEIEYIVNDHLEDLAANRLAPIAKEYGMKVREVQEIADVIRELEPKPGSLFSDGVTTAYVIPDVIVEKIGGEYVVTVSEGGGPHLSISPYYRRLMGSADADGELSAFLSGRFNAALWLIKSIEHRRQTIYNVVSGIVSHQLDFFEHGKKHLKPLTLKKIADEVGIHESTVSRAVNGKYMQTPRGVFEIRYFFKSGVSDSSDSSSGGVASDGVKARISELLSTEDKSSPLSDQAIAKELNADGLDISRRTVAKYRDEMGIQASPMRKRY